MGYKPQFDQSLEAVADPQRQPVSLIQEFLDRLPDLFILKSCGEEFGGAVRFIPRGKSAREHDHLGLADGMLKFRHRIPDVRGRQVFEHPCDHLCPRPGKCPGAVVFAVGPWEDRDKYRGLSDLMGAHVDIRTFIQSIFIDAAVRCLFSRRRRRGNSSFSVL